MDAPHGAQPQPAPTADPLHSTRRLPDARAVARAWRALTGGRTTPDARRRTLVACSGGADSTALLLILASAARAHVVAAHVVHDLRSPAEALADRDAVRALADRLGVAFACAPVAVRARPGNPEASARRARYTALIRLAGEHACPFVAVAHQGDDLVETMLMRLLRGAGPRGLGVLRERRPLAPGIDLVRPMLALTRERSRALCRGAGVAWREDATNADASRWRARLRRDVLPVLASLRPAMHDRFRAAAGLLHDAALLIDRSAQEILDKADADHSGLSWSFDHLARLSPLLLGAVLRLAHDRLVGPAGLDRLDDRIVRAIHRALRDPDRRPRTWTVGGLRIETSAATVTLRPAHRRPRAGPADPAPAG